jgi:hypothetical protein
MNTPTPITESHRKLAVELMLALPSQSYATASVSNAAKLIADSEARAVASAVTALTCTHHNDAERTACPVCLVTALTAERDELRDDRANEIAWAKWASHHLADAIEVKAERDQLRAKAERFQRLQRFIDTAAAEMKAGLITFGGIAELRAERDQLRAENSNLRVGQKACEACDEPTAFEVRQFRAEMERLRADRDCEKRLRKDADEFRENAIARAEKAEAELTELHDSFAGNVHAQRNELRAELAAEREKAERYRLASLKLDAELATERARLDWVFRNCKVTADDFTTGNRDVYAIHDREDLGAAMKEGAQ